MEPVNPLFEEEKEFLERKRLEYERALRGDVEQLKEQGLQVGKVALIGAGVVGGVWLLSKALGGKKKRRAADDYFDDEPADYDSQYFAEFDDDENGYEPEHDVYFGGEGPGHGSVYHTDTDQYDEPDLAGDRPGEADADDNGLHEYPDFPAHSGAGHGQLPYDDSRRLPESDDFAEPAPASLGSRLVSFAQSNLGKLLLGQAVSVAAALATKVLKERLAASTAETTKTSDLAVSTAESDGYAHGHPATPQPAAPDAYLAADAPAEPIAYREPLA